MEDQNIAEVARLAASVGIPDLQRFFREHWWAPRPNRGAILVRDERIVGYVMAIYSQRLINHRRENFCSLGSWYVQPQYRAHSLRLLSFILSQRGFTFTALTPNSISAAVLTRFRFRPLSTGLVIHPPLAQAHTLLRPARVTTDRAQIAERLNQYDRLLLQDHEEYACGHVLIESEGQYAYVLTKRRRLRRIPVSEILYASDRDLATRHFERLKLAIMQQDGSAATMAEARILGSAAPFGLQRRRMRLFRSETLDKAEIDNLYSEIVLT